MTSTWTDQLRVVLKVHHSVRYCGTCFKMICVHTSILMTIGFIKLDIINKRKMHHICIRQIFSDPCHYKEVLSFSFDSSKY